MICRYSATVKIEREDDEGNTRKVPVQVNGLFDGLELTGDYGYEFFLDKSEPPLTERELSFALDILCDRFIELAEFGYYDRKDEAQ